MLLSRAYRLPDVVRGLYWSSLIRMMGGKVGPKLRVARGAHMRYPPHRGWLLGSNVYIGRGAILEVHPRASLHIADNVKIMHYAVVASVQEIRIGVRAQIAEHSSVRDHDHGLESENIQDSPLRCKPVVIEDDSWVGRGTAVLKGSRIGTGAVVGANSVVNSPVPPHTVCAGAPARLIRRRYETH